jgi:hypothetical protein
MKIRIALICLFILTTLSVSHASVTISLQLGEITDTGGSTIPGGTLWALISEDSSGNLPGGLLTDDSLYNNNTQSTVISHFGGITISAGSTIGGGYVVATGGSLSSPAGDIDEVIASFDFVGAGLSEGDKLGVYWFPGRTTSLNTLTASNFEIGGFHRTAANIPSGGNGGLVIPSDGTTVTAVYFDNNITGGDSGIAPTEFQAITVVPEPSTFLLLTTGFLFLILRRR